MHAPKQPVSRRKFVKYGLFGAGGLTASWWLGSSGSFAARFLRDRLSETGREIKPAAAKPTPLTWNDNSITATWLGHSTVLISFYGIGILTDPVLFPRVGADLRLGTCGPKRLIAPALTPTELPAIDLVLLSHAHFDHWDIPSLRCFDSATRVIAPKSTFDLLKRTRFGASRELAWGDRTTVKTEQGELAVEAFEVRHWGARLRRDTYRGYNGYVLSCGGKKIIFGGDTAMTHTFGELKSKGPFTLACMPIGSYNPWVRSHCNPEEAVAMSNAAGAEYILPIHHQTFKLSRERSLEPIERFEQALALTPSRIALRKVGETFSISA